MWYHYSSTSVYIGATFHLTIYGQATQQCGEVAIALVCGCVGWCSIMLCVNNFKIWTVHCMNYQLRCSTSCSCTYHRRQEVDFWPRLTHICTCFKHLLDIGTLLHLADLISNPARKSYKDLILRFLSDQIRLDELAILRFPGCLSTNHSKNWHMHEAWPVETTS